MPNFIKIVKDKSSIYADQLITFSNNEIMFLSACGYATDIRSIILKKDKNSSIDTYSYVRFYLSDKNYQYSTIVSSNKNIITAIPHSRLRHLLCYRDADSFNSKSYAHQEKLFYLKLADIITYAKEHCIDLSAQALASFSWNNNVAALFKDCSLIHDKIFDLINKYYSIPMLEEWLPYLMSNTADLPAWKSGLVLRGGNCYYADYTADENIISFSLTVDTYRLKEAISEGLRKGLISIPQANANAKTKSIYSLKAYLDEYADTLLKKAANSFQPLFDSQCDKFPEKLLDHFAYCKSKGFSFFAAQKNVIASMSKALTQQKCAFIVGEPGVGKTAMAVSMAYTQAKSRNIVVLCPSHLLHKWEAEITRLWPTKVKIVSISSLRELINIEKELRNIDRDYSIVVLLSKDCAKQHYQLRPAVQFDSKTGYYKCPCCGKAIAKDNYYYSAKPTISNLVQQFLHKNKDNSKCQYCNTELWTAVNPSAPSSWFKAQGLWLNKTMLSDFVEAYDNNNISLSPTVNKIYNIALDTLENGVQTMRYNRKYSIGRYIRKHLKCVFDFAIIDEIHMYAANSTQAKLAHDLSFASKHTLGLTGTLTNGKAETLRDLLYPFFTSTFKRHRYNYRDTDFTRKYGRRLLFTQETTPQGNTRELPGKALPGISPSVYPDFLISNCAFISLADIKEYMPLLKETAVGLTLDKNTDIAYKNIEAEFKRLLQTGELGRDFAAQALVRLSNFLEMPYNTVPIFTRDGILALNFPDAVSDAEQYVSQKDIECLRLIREKLAKNERILVYANYTHRTDVIDRLSSLLAALSIRVCVLDNTITAQKREQYIQKQLADGIEVMLCNPSCVSTGLDMVEFTTIIMYDSCFSLYTAMQACRRSYRIITEHDISIFHLYYKGTIQEIYIEALHQKIKAANMLMGRIGDGSGLANLASSDDMITDVLEHLTKSIKDKH